MPSSMYAFATSGNRRCYSSGSWYLNYRKYWWVKYGVYCVVVAFTAPWGGEMRGSDRGRLREVSDALCFLVFHCTSLYFFVFPCIIEILSFVIDTRGTYQLYSYVKVKLFRLQQVKERRAWSVINFAFLDKNSLSLKTKPGGKKVEQFSVEQPSILKVPLENL